MELDEARRLAGAGATDAALDGLRALATDPAVDPIQPARAGWEILAETGRLPSPDEEGARRVEASGPALAFLTETCVTHPPSERALTALRRWLLLSGRAAGFPALTAALVAQAARNGGAWPFDDEERAALARPDGAVLAAAYLPKRPRPGPAIANPSPVKRAVAEQYEIWPYPVWERVTRPRGDTLAGMIARLGPEPIELPEAPSILVAGCGTGRETALIAMRAPEARITAIDLSAASLAYAAERWASLGITNVRWEQRDLRDAPALGRFDLISCSGVLHHLPSPEADWARLVEALKPGGVMSIMVYSKLARLRVRSAQHRIADLLDRPVDDDLLREARGRLLADPVHALTWSPDFASLGGVHDLLFNRHEDLFDVPRIRRGIESLGLEFLGFELPGKTRRARYRSEHPHDPWFRDFDAWAATEWREPELFSGMYHFWCRRP